MNTFLIPLIQGRFLFEVKVVKPRGNSCLNPFGSGTFFIRPPRELARGVEVVLIPLVQGRFLFGFPERLIICFVVLIPLVQGRFLFKPMLSYSAHRVSLNPFGSGTFFIHRKR